MNFLVSICISTLRTLYKKSSDGYPNDKSVIKFIIVVGRLCRTIWQRFTKLWLESCNFFGYNTFCHIVIVLNSVAKNSKKVKRPQSYFTRIYQPWHSGFSGRQWIVSEQNKGAVECEHLLHKYKNKNPPCDCGEAKQTINHIVIEWPKNYFLKACMTCIHKTTTITQKLYIEKIKILDVDL